MEYREFIGKVDDLHTDLIGLSGIIHTIETEGITSQSETVTTQEDVFNALSGAGSYLRYILNCMEEAVDEASGSVPCQEVTA